MPGPAGPRAPPTLGLEAVSPPGAEATVKLIVIDPQNCGHCAGMKERIALFNAGSIADNKVHVYELGSDAGSDQMGFVVAGDCPFPHCFEYVGNPAWVAQFLPPGHPAAGGCPAPAAAGAFRSLV